MRKIKKGRFTRYLGLKLCAVKRGFITSLSQLGSQAIFRHKQWLRFKPDLCEPWWVHFRWVDSCSFIHGF